VAQLLEPDLGVLFFVARGLEEELRQLLEALTLGDGGKVGVLVAGLALAGEGGLKVLLGLVAGVLVDGGCRGLVHRTKADAGCLQRGPGSRGSSALMNVSAHRAFPLFHGFLLRFLVGLDRVQQLPDRIPGEVLPLGRVEQRL
jgi:hypothetical protein